MTRLFSEEIQILLGNLIAMPKKLGCTTAIL